MTLTIHDLRITDAFDREADRRPEFIKGDPYCIAGRAPSSEDKIPFEARMAEIDVSLRNFGEEMRALETCLRAGERFIVDALSKFQAVQDRRQELMAEFATLRADRRKSS